MEVRANAMRNPDRKRSFEFQCVLPSEEFSNEMLWRRRGARCEARVRRGHRAGLMTLEAYEVEARALVGLARALRQRRGEFGTSEREIAAQVERALVHADPIQIERGLEGATRALRRAWLILVAAEACNFMRSPTEQESARLERRTHDAYGYERDFQPTQLEARCEAFFDAPPKHWSAAHVLYSSGQAALTNVIVQLARQRSRKLKVAHIGCYFETRSLIEHLCERVEGIEDADCAVVEPLACDGRFSTHDAGAIASELGEAKALIVDETLCAPVSEMNAIACRASGRGLTLFRLISGLKLLQQGLELANVGIVSVMSEDKARVDAAEADLRMWRTLTGSGVRFLDALALDAPFFLDRPATRAYAHRIFAHNAELCRAVMRRNRLFKPQTARLAAAPYATFELREGNSADALEDLGQRIAREARARGILVERGGSFGFRGHRFDVMKPDAGEPFLRVALGARDGLAREGLTALLAEIAERGAGFSLA